jgi:hypothetical protein
VFQQLLEHSVTPQSCIEAFHLCRSVFERATEAKIRARELTEDGNVELTARDLKRARPPVGLQSEQLVPAPLHR